MNQETIRYILNYFSYLLTETEGKAMRHSHSLIKLNHDISESSRMARLYYKNGWLSTDPAVLDLLKDGNEAFEQMVAQRIMSRTPEKVFFNNCPKCGQLARTPYARQCRCGYQWHHTLAARFLLDDAFQITGRPFFIVGKLTEGKIERGNFLDLRRIGINHKPIIETVEIVTKRQEGVFGGYIGLGVSDVTDAMKEFIKKKDFRIEPLDILNEI